MLKAGSEAGKCQDQRKMMMMMRRRRKRAVAAGQQGKNWSKHLAMHAVPE